MTTRLKPSVVRRLQLPGEELVLLVRRHVAVLAAAHVEVGADRARLQSVPLDGVAPEAHEVLVDVGVGAQHLRDVELDARAEALLGRGLDQGLRRVEPGGELAGQRVEGDAELDPGPGDAGVVASCRLPSGSDGLGEVRRELRPRRRRRR